MDKPSPIIKKVRIIYVALAAILTACAIVSAYIHHIYVATAFIVLASLTIFIGSVIISYIFRIQKARDLD